jgi:hypothetical protein
MREMQPPTVVSDDTTDRTGIESSSRFAGRARDMSQQARDKMAIETTKKASEIQTTIRAEDAALSQKVKKEMSRDMTERSRSSQNSDTTPGIDDRL